MTIAYLWPILLIVTSNIVYQICAKSVPEKLNPFAALTITYAVATLLSLLFFYISGKGGGILKEVHNTNWAPFVLGLVIVGLEAGYLFAYKAGWNVSTAAVTQSAILAIALIFVGYLLFKEQITWNKVVGVLICCVGLVFINK